MERVSPCVFHGKLAEEFHRLRRQFILFHPHLRDPGAVIDHNQETFRGAFVLIGR